MDGGWARQGRKGDKIVMLHLLNNQAVKQMLVTFVFLFVCLFFPEESELTQFLI